MDHCPFSPQLGAYHDGELPRAQVAALEQHLASCATCPAELEQIRRLSAALAAATVPRLPIQVREELYALAPEVGRAVYVRFAEWTTALAASLLIAAGGWMFYHQNAQPNVNEQAQALAWTHVALDPPRPAEATDVPEEPHFVDWVASNISAGQNP